MARQFTKESNDKITYPHLSALDGVGVFFLWFRLYPSSCDSSGGLVYQMSADGLYGFGIGFSNFDATMLGAFVRNGNSDNYKAWSSVLTLDTWHTIGMLFNGSYNNGGAGESISRINLYVNDVFKPETTNFGPTSTTCGVNTAPVILADLNDLSNRGFTGRLADVGLWIDVVPTAAQRTALHNGVPLNDVLPNSQRFYAPLDSAYTSGVNDLIGGKVGTVSGTSTVAHPTGIPTSAPTFPPITAHPHTTHSAEGNLYTGSVPPSTRSAAIPVDYSEALGGYVTVKTTPAGMGIGGTVLYVDVYPAYGTGPSIGTIQSFAFNLLPTTPLVPVSRTVRLGAGKWALTCYNTDISNAQAVEITDVRIEGIG